MKKNERLDDVLNLLSVRAQNCLAAADVFTINELIDFEAWELLRFRNLGKKSYNEIVKLVESLRLEFGQKTKSIQMTPELFQLLVAIKRHTGNYTELFPLINDLRKIL